MNLIKDPWISVVKKSGERGKISISNIVDTKDPAIRMDFPRPDFDGSAITLLIGIFQTILPPETKEEWLNYFNSPPTQKTLIDLLKPLEPFFDVNDKPGSFYQDPNPNQLKTTVEIGDLFLNFPGDKTKKESRDFFVKRNSLQQICPECAAIGQYLKQQNCSSGGAGYGQGLRRGGPLTTLLYGKTLFETVWLNIMLKPDIEEKTGSKYDLGIDNLFAWAIPFKKIKQSDVHPCHCFFASPRREFIIYVNRSSSCCVCGKNTDILATHLKKNESLRYVEKWYHPLSPFKTKSKKVINALAEQGSLLSLPIFCGMDQKHTPAYAFHDEERKKLAISLWLFGYGMKLALFEGNYVNKFLPIITEAELPAVSSYKKIKDLLKKVASSEEIFINIENIFFRTYPSLSDFYEQLGSFILLRRPYLSSSIAEKLTSLYEYGIPKILKIPAKSIYIKKKPIKISREISQALLKYWNVLRYRPELLSNIRKCSSYKEIRRTDAYNNMYQYEALGMIEPERLALILCLMSRIKNHDSQKSFIGSAKEVLSFQRFEIFLSSSIKGNWISFIEAIEYIGTVSITKMANEIIHWKNF